MLPRDERVREESNLPHTERTDSFVMDEFLLERVKPAYGDTHFKGQDSPSRAAQAGSAEQNQSHNS
jgi:hypothetical protein